MTTQNYLMISTVTNVVENICLWDGDVNAWQPPANTLMLIQADISAMVWKQVVGSKPPAWVLTEVLGVGGIGFTWDGTVLTTNQPEPQPPVAEPNQPSTTGTATA
jgi:hypothetical protein